VAALSCGRLVLWPPCPVAALFRAALFSAALFWDAQDPRAPVPCCLRSATARWTPRTRRPGHEHEVVLGPVGQQVAGAESKLFVDDGLAATLPATNCMAVCGCQVGPFKRNGASDALSAAPPVPRRVVHDDKPRHLLSTLVRGLLARGLLASGPLAIVSTLKHFFCLPG
jgi:hypothetical protein